MSRFSIDVVGVVAGGTAVGVIVVGIAAGVVADGTAVGVLVVGIAAGVVADGTTVGVIAVGKLTFLRRGSIAAGGKTAPREPGGRLESVSMHLVKGVDVSEAATADVAQIATDATYSQTYPPGDHSMTSPDDAQKAAAQCVFQCATGHFTAAALQTAVKLRIPDQLAHGERAVTDLAVQSDANEGALYRILRALAAAGFFQETTPQNFALTTAGELLRSDAPGSLHAAALWLTSPFHFRVYADMLHSVRTGRTAAEMVTGVPVFAYLAQNQELSEVFNNAMTSMSQTFIPPVLEAYDFSGIERLVDVGGGHGAVLTAVLQRYPEMRGTLFDVDHVIEGASQRIASLDLQTRCEAVSGDFFASVPRGDAYVLKHIIHDWDDSRAEIILRNIRMAISGGPKGRVLLIEAVIQPGNQPDFAKVIDLEMLVMASGRERTSEEFAALFAKTGFELTRLVPTSAPVNIIEARPC